MLQAALLLLSLAGACAAEEGEVAPSAPLTADTMQLLELAGLAPETIVQMFGEPERRSASDTSENWYYGESTIFFTGGKVAAWTGGEHLNQLRMQCQFMKPEDKGSEDYERGVVSDWRPEANVSSDDVIKEIVGDPPADGATPRGVEDGEARAKELER